MDVYCYATQHEKWANGEDHASILHINSHSETPLENQKYYATVGVQHIER